MRQTIVLSVLSALVVCVSGLPAAQQGLGPCELIPAAEIAKFLGAAAVQLDSVNTGTNEFTKVALCSWMVDPKDPRGVTVKLRQAESADETEAALLGARIDEGLTLDKMEALPGVGAGAWYAPWADGSGSTVIARKGAQVVTVTGTVPKATALAMAKTAVGRM
jgi:hypothetical protein